MSKFCTCTICGKELKITLEQRANSSSASELVCIRCFRLKQAMIKSATVSEFLKEVQDGDFSKWEKFDSHPDKK
jgi:hypothetical protein